MSIEEAIDLAYSEQGSGPALVLLHGLGLDHTIWMSIARNCSSYAKVIMPDLRGHGLSGAPEGIYTMDMMAADIKRLMDRIRIEKIVLAGHSMGGYVALAFAQEYPDLLNGLILVTTNADEDPPDKRQARILLATEIEKQGSGVMADSLANRLTDDPILISKMHFLINRTTPKGLIGASLGMAERKDMHEVLRSLTCPSLIIAGENDRITSLSTAEKLVETCQKGKLVIMPNAGHLPMMEEPEVMTIAILGFMRVNSLLDT
jgi:pimeloyl-ACP methyl ester carboxylesterase